jgi:hypothetical protein
VVAAAAQDGTSLCAALLRWRAIAVGLMTPRAAEGRQEGQRCGGPMVAGTHCDL